MMIRTIFLKMVIGFALMLAWQGAGWAQPAPSSAAAEPALQSNSDGAVPAPDYVLGPEDIVEVDVLGRPDFKTKARIEADGTIQLPLIGRVPAGDRTARVLGEQVRVALQSGGFFANPIVQVDVGSYASRYVTVLGAVGNPGLVPVNRQYRLSEILARVGGVKEVGADYVILRRENGPEQRLSVKGLAAGDISQDPFVAAGDKIFSPIADLFYISGQVNAPGSFPLISNTTVAMALARAGGLTPSGSDKRVTVRRNGTKVKLDLSARVEAGDVIVVGERLF